MTDDSRGLAPGAQDDLREGRGKMMRVGRRSPVEMKGDILAAIDMMDIPVPGIEPGVSVTPVMYKANMSWNRMRELVKMMVREGLIRCKDYGPHRSRLSLTSKGRHVLSDYRSSMLALDFDSDSHPRPTPPFRRDE